MDINLIILFYNSYLKEADNLLAATKVSTKASRSKIPHVDEQNVPKNIIESIKVSILSSEEENRKELAKKRSINFDAKPPLGTSDTFNESQLVTYWNS
jgi:hypothetical protein